MDRDPREAGSASIRDRNSPSFRASRAVCESGDGRACGRRPGVRPGSFLMGERRCRHEDDSGHPDDGLA